jgi:hypothetical protein
MTTKVRLAGAKMLHMASFFKNHPCAATVAGNLESMPI